MSDVLVWLLHLSAGFADHPFVSDCSPGRSEIPADGNHWSVPAELKRHSKPMAAIEGTVIVFLPLHDPGEQSDTKG